MSNTTRFVFLFFGSLAFLAGVLGVFLPVLPTTPFLLLAAWCFSRSSQRFHAWLVTHKYFGPPILDWEKHQVIRTRHKIIATVMVSLTGFGVVVWSTMPWIGKLGYFLVVAPVLIFVWTRKGSVSSM